ncbi:unnamed protein product [Polarella glacialis]|uniref:Uncharacterized protein n=1 Tax=Polarella glacialis TaxID=89957 RepID=A0A813F7L3_POLGL|nr:unnamed protein product [Polarella glacialis]
MRAHLLEEEGQLRCVWSTCFAAAGALTAIDDGWEVEEDDGGVARAVRCPEERVMAIGCLQDGDGGQNLLVAAASSSGFVRCWRLDFGAPRVEASSHLAVASGGKFIQRLSRTAALCAECFRIAGLPAILIGCADGSVAACGLDPLLRSCEADDSSKQTVWLEAQLHDAGINDLALKTEGLSNGTLLLAAAGDDHRLSLSVLAFENGSDTGLRMWLQGSRRFDGAHTSSVRALQWAGPELLSLGLDRRLRVWELLPVQREDADASAVESEASPRETEGQCPGLREKAVLLSSCTEPEVLAVAHVRDVDSETQDFWALVLAGRGVEICSRHRDSGASSSA